MSPDTIIDDLDVLSLRALHARYLFEVSEHERDPERLRASVRDGYWNDVIPAGAIRAHAQAARDARIEAANRIIAENNRTIAAQHARIRELEARFGTVDETAGQFLVTAMLRDQREDAR